nr:MAG TPA: hypothetical protein [Myoviridae sp. ctfuG5]DAN24623.1 MAG TPA: hypothetical protein [Caudoviricetes sp.]
MLFTFGTLLSEMIALLIPYLVRFLFSNYV